MKQRAIVLTDGLYHTSSAKTAHGLVRGSRRFNIEAIIDRVHHGKDAGHLLDGENRRIPIYATIDEALAKLDEKPDCVVVGVAAAGGRLSNSLVKDIAHALNKTLPIVNGLHEMVATHPDLGPLAQRLGVPILDIRKPKPFSELHHWSGAIMQVKAPRIAVLGMDCSAGKRTTCKMLTDACNADGIKAEMIYTGQTGWMQGFPYGLILDSTLNDFVSGELEHAVVTCDREAKPDVIFLEGQSALRNPSGPCGAEFICSAKAAGVILQYIPSRSFFKGQDGISPMPALIDEIDLIERYGTKVIAITINTLGLTDGGEAVRAQIKSETGLPTVCPREKGVAKLLPVISRFIEDHRSA